MSIGFAHILGVLAGMLSPLGLLGYLRFCKLCNSHSKISFNFALFFYSLLYFLYDDVNNDVYDDDTEHINTFL